MSSYKYTRSVLMEMAVAVEKSAGDFYITMSRMFREHEPLFKQLAADEEDHANAYTKLLKSRDVYSTEEDRKLADYNLEILENTGVVSNLRRGVERARNMTDLQSAVAAAVQMEKDTMLFYSDMAMALGPRDRQEIFRIVQLEHSHLYKVQHITL